MQVIANLQSNHQGILHRAKGLIQAVAGGLITHVELPKFKDDELGFDAIDHIKLKKWAAEHRLKYGLCISDRDSLAEVCDIGLDYIKISSSRATDYSLLHKVFSDFKGPVHIVVGKLSPVDKERLFAYIEPNLARCVVYHEFDGKMPEKFIATEGIRVSSPDTGFGIVAASRGAQWIDYDVTFSRESEGETHTNALLPHELKVMARSARNVEGLN